MRVLVTGSSGQLGTYVLDHLARGPHEVIAWSGRQTGRRGEVELKPVDLTDPGEVDRELLDASPDAILHLAAQSRADAVWRDPAMAWRINVEATQRLAGFAAARGARFVFTSTDLVFDGGQPWWREGDEPKPVLAYGRSKRDAEVAVFDACPGALVARLSLMYGPSRGGTPTFFDQAMAALRRGEARSFFTEEFRTPLDYATAAEVLVRLLEQPRLAGPLHVAGPERLSRLDLFQRAGAALGIDPTRIQPGTMADVEFPEPRPVDVSLDTTRLMAIFPDLVRPRVEEAVMPGGPG